MEDKTEITIEEKIEITIEEKTETTIKEAMLEEIIGDNVFQRASRSPKKNLRNHHRLTIHIIVITTVLVIIGLKPKSLIFGET